MEKNKKLNMKSFFIFKSTAKLRTTLKYKQLLIQKRTTALLNFEQNSLAKRN